MSLPTLYQQFIHLSRYARWRDDVLRRETWEETGTRYFDFFTDFLSEKRGYDLDTEMADDMYSQVYSLEVMPSMRCMMTAGRALSRDHVVGYNCAYRAISDPRAFDEILFVLMCGTGVGFSVERQFVNRLPKVSENFERSNTIIIVRDSKRGWAEAFRELIAMLYAGRVPQWDISRVRKAGSRLKTMGGRASGPGPLVELFDFTVRMLTEAAGRRLTSIECHDLVCKVGWCVLVGGVRRAALLSLSNLSDQRMRDAKAGQWWETEPQRALANNSIAFTETPEVGQFMQEWLSLFNSKSGERGIFNREAARLQAMKSGRRRGYWDNGEEQPINFGTNPCSEIMLRSREFCNLTEVVARSDDDFESLKRKIRTATILGTWQACLTDFRYLTKRWRDNCEEERLLGVSITGMMDCPILHDECRAVLPDLFRELKNVAVETNAEWAELLKINPATAITCVKPSGTVSQLVDAASGIHPRHAQTYIRRVRQDMKDPLTRFMIDAGFPHEPDVTQPQHMMVFEFPVRAPEGSVCRDEWTAIKQLEHWKVVQDHWCEHKPSITVTVREREWPEVGAWVWRHFDHMSGVSFLPHSGHTYRQAPYEVINEEQLAELESRVPKSIDWSELQKYEQDDYTTGAKELACTATQCDI